MPRKPRAAVAAAPDAVAGVEPAATEPTPGDAAEAAQDDRSAIATVIRAHPTASDAQVAAAAGAPRSLVAEVRAGLGPKHTWNS